MKNRSPFWACVVACIVSSANASPIIPGYERFHQDESLLQSMGVLLAGELNCLSCHANEQVAKVVSTKTAPNLMNVGARVKPAYLRRFIANPVTTKPGTTMPNLLHGTSESVSKQAATGLCCRGVDSSVRDRFVRWEGHAHFQVPAEAGTE